MDTKILEGLMFDTPVSDLVFMSIPMFIMYKYVYSKAVGKGKW